jgi:ABC-2 type transport system permease protein
VFPSLFFWFFGIPNAPDADGLAMLTASFCAFAVLSVVLFQFGIGVATDRETSWYSYLTGAASPKRNAIARYAFCLELSSQRLGVLGVLATARFLGDLDFAPYHWGQFLLTLALGAFPFACLGLALGLIVSARDHRRLFSTLTYLAALVCRGTLDAAKHFAESRARCFRLPAKPTLRRTAVGHAFGR